MSSKSLDTSQQAYQVMIEGFRRMPGWQKLRRVGELTELLHNLALSEIRQRHPTANNRKLRLYLSSRWLPDDLLKEGFGWDTKKEGY